MIKFNESYKTKLMESWAPVIDVEGLNDVKNDAVRGSLAIVLENTLADLKKGGFNPNALLKEAAFDNAVETGLNGGAQNTITATQQDWKAGDVRIPLAVIPLARRMFTQLIAHDLVGVQAMASPTGYAAAYRYVYGDNTGLEGKELIWGVTDADKWAAVSGKMDYVGDPIAAKEAALEPSETAVISALEGFGMEATEVDGKVVIKKASGMTVGEGENVSFADKSLPRVAMKLEKVLVEAKSRKIGTSISMEDAEDALVTLGLDVNEAMVNILAMDLKNSIDRELIQEIVVGCLGTKERAAKSFSTWNAAKADGLDQLGRLSTLYTHILQMSKRVQFNTKMGTGANWMVCSSPVSALVERIGDWKLAENDVTVDGAAIAYAGTLRRGQIKVYNDALSDKPYILLGWKGSQITETGVVYCPYIPAQILSGPDVDRFGARLMARSRYAIVNSIFGSNLFYQFISLEGIGAEHEYALNGQRVFATI